MDEHPFFKLVWRVNAIIILGLALAGAVSFLYLILSFGAFEDTEPLVIESQNEASISSTKLKSRLGQDISGNDLILVSVHTGYDSGYGSLGSSKPSEFLNYGAFSPDTLQTTWLFPSNDQIISNINNLNKIEGSGEDHIITVTGFILTVIDADTNGDGGLSSKDDGILYYASPDLSTKTRLYEGLQRSAGLKRVDNSSYLIYFTTESGFSVLQFNPDTREIIQSGQIKPPK